MSLLIDDISSRREKNIQEFEEFLKGYLDSEEGKEAKIVTEKYRSVLGSSQYTPKKKRRQTDVFRAKVKIPLERRSSSRLKNVQPQYTYEDLPDEVTIARKLRQSYSEDDLNDLETVIGVPIKRRTSINKATNFVIVPVESITEEYLANVAANSTKKKYDSKNGTSCHQCRQKTTDSKTYCRNKSCFGVRGQFCGPCLRNRYGEEAAVALKDPNWHCPVCRGICNCSFCRNKLGKRPTGILAPIAQKNGHASVHHLLLDLKGLGDYANEDKTDEYEIDKIEHDHKVCLANSEESELDSSFLGFCDITQQPVHSSKKNVDQLPDDGRLNSVETVIG